MQMLMRTDPFRELDRMSQQVFGSGTLARPSAMPMDAWRESDSFVVEFDLPGVTPESIDVDVERNVVTVQAERSALDTDREMIAAEPAPGGSSAGSSCSAPTSTPTTWRRAMTRAF